MAIVLCLVTSTGVLAADTVLQHNPIVSHKIYAPTLAEMANNLKQDSLVKSVQFSNNILTYILQDGTTTSIIMEKSGNNVNYFITEENQFDRVTINETFQSIAFNDQKINFDLGKNGFLVSMEEQSIAQDQYTPRYNQWHYMGTTYPDIFVERAIASLSSGALYTILYGVMGGIGVAMSLATTIIQYFVTINSTARSFYAIREMYYFGDYVQFKYIDKYYANSNYTGYITSQTTTGLGGARAF